MTSINPFWMLCVWILCVGFLIAAVWSIGLSVALWLGPLIVAWLSGVR